MERSPQDPRVRPLARGPGLEAELELVALRMRATLEEVLGAERGRALYDMDWLRERVRWHLDPAQRGEVWLACDPPDQILGHSIVRLEPELGPGVGLFSTTYVLPSARRTGLAQCLLQAGESWLRAAGATQATTHTAAGNQGLIALFEGRGYAITLRAEAMVRLSKALVD